MSLSFPLFPTFFVLIPKPPAAAKDKGKLPAFFFFYLNKTLKKSSLLWEGGQKSLLSS